MSGLEFGTFIEYDSSMDKEDFVPPMYQQDISGNMSVFTGELKSLTNNFHCEFFVIEHLLVLVTNAFTLNCILTRFNRWTSHIADIHAQDNEQHIGTQDLGQHGLQTRVPRRNASDATLFDIPNLSAHLLSLRDVAYNISKVGKDVLKCFHLHYFMIHYCYLSLDTSTAIGQLIPFTTRNCPFCDWRL